VRKPQVIPDEDHEVIYERVAAVDVAKASGVVCMRTPDPARPGRFVNRIWDNVPATRARIAELGQELLRCQVQMVTLESTSDYWRIWYYVLESTGLAVHLVSASQAKNLKGRPKTDPLTELPGGVPQVSGRVGALVATVADHDHRRRYAAGPVATGDAAGRVA
jgi:transposase